MPHLLRKTNDREVRVLSRVCFGLGVAVAIACGTVAAVADDSATKDATVKDAAAKDAAVKDEQARLEGVWSFASVKVNGQPQPGAGHEADRLIFQKDGRFTVVQRLGITHGTFKVNPGHTPKQYDVRIETGRLKGISVPAIYELSGDTLTICMPLGGSERPTVLESKPNDGHLFEVFKRERETVKEALIAAGRRELTATWQAEAYALDGKPASAADLKKSSWSSMPRATPRRSMTANSSSRVRPRSIRRLAQQRSTSPSPAAKGRAAGRSASINSKTTY